MLALLGTYPARAKEGQFPGTLLRDIGRAGGGSLGDAS